MRDRPNWLTGFHLLVLNIYYESGILSTLSVGTFTDNLPYTREHISRELSKLESHGLLIEVSEGKYRLSDVGRAYLAGDLDASELSEEGEDGNDA